MEKCQALDPEKCYIDKESLKSFDIYQPEMLRRIKDPVNIIVTGTVQQKIF